MAIDDLLQTNDWFHKRLEKGQTRNFEETAKIAANEKIKVAELEEKNRQLQDEINRLKGEKSKPKIKPANTKDLNPPAKKPRKKESKEN